MTLIIAEINFHEHFQIKKFQTKKEIYFWDYILKKNADFK